MKKEIVMENNSKVIEILEREQIDEILANLYTSEIIAAAYRGHVPEQKDGYARLDLCTGELISTNLDDNEKFPDNLPIITIYRVAKSVDKLLWPQDVLKGEELKDFETSNLDLHEYIKLKGINKVERVVQFLEGYYYKDVYDVDGQLEQWYGREWQSNIMNINRSKGRS